MTDIEKVLKGLECCSQCTNEDPFTGCDECPYNNVSISVQECRAVLCDDALELLAMKKPKPQRYLDRDLFKLPLCPNENCNAVMTKEWHYCPYCGTPIEFDDALDRTMRKRVQSMMKG